MCVLSALFSLKRFVDYATLLTKQIKHNDFEVLEVCATRKLVLKTVSPVPFVEVAIASIFQYQSLLNIFYENIRVNRVYMNAQKYSTSKPYKNSFRI